MEHGFNNQETRKLREEILATQNGYCAICLRKITGKGNLDHCHTTGKVRGVLCTACNTGLGFFWDSPETLVAAIEYIVRHTYGDDKRVICEWTSERGLKEIGNEYQRILIAPLTIPKRKPRKRHSRTHTIFADEFSLANEFGILS